MEFVFGEHPYYATNSIAPQKSEVLISMLVMKKYPGGLVDKSTCEGEIRSKEKEKKRKWGNQGINTM
jgi:hypothetical protein